MATDTRKKKNANDGSVVIPPIEQPQQIMSQDQIDAVRELTKAYGGQVEVTADKPAAQQSSAPAEPTATNGQPSVNIPSLGKPQQIMSKEDMDTARYVEKELAASAAKDNAPANQPGVTQQSSPSASSDTVDAIRKNGEDYLDAVKANNAALDAAAETTIKEQEAANKATEKSFEDFVLDAKREAELAKQQDEAMTKAEQKSATWAGLTELMAGMINLYGVGVGNAVSQQYHSFSQDWMQRADANSKERRARMDNMRNRRRELERQLLALKTGNANALIQARSKAAEAKTARDLGLAKAAYEANNAAVNASLKSDALEQQVAEQTNRDRGTFVVGDSKSYVPYATVSALLAGKTEKADYDQAIKDKDWSKAIEIAQGVASKDSAFAKSLKVAGGDSNNTTSKKKSSASGLEAYE